VGRLRRSDRTSQSRGVQKSAADRVFGRDGIMGPISGNFRAVMRPSDFRGRMEPAPEERPQVSQGPLPGLWDSRLDLRRILEGRRVSCGLSPRRSWSRRQRIPISPPRRLQVAAYKAASNKHLEGLPPIGCRLRCQVLDGTRAKGAVWPEGREPARAACWLLKELRNPQVFRERLVQ
jgi:hypothetical protein